MAKRKNISFKTKYSSIEECRVNCVDVEGMPLFGRSLSSKFYGVFHEDNSFVLTSVSKVAYSFEFEGTILQKDDGIYLEGEIRVKKKSLYIVYLSILLSVLFGVMLVLSFNVVFMFMGILFMIIPWFNLNHINRSDALYNLLIKRNS